MNIAFYTLGCKVNQYDTMVLETKFKELNYKIVPCNEKADIYVINSCTVTSVADKKTKQVINRFKRNNSNSIISLIGCFPQAFYENMGEIKDVDIVLGSTNKFELPNKIELFLLNRVKIFEIETKAKRIDYISQVNNFFCKTRAFLKIEDGCDRYCKYCIIPKARGKVISKDLDTIKKEVELICTKGIKEIVVVGVNLSCYGKDIYNTTLLDVLYLINSFDQIKRIQLGSLEPNILTYDFIKELHKIKKVSPHFHLSIQSGSDKILKSMNRHYLSKDCLEAVSNVRNLYECPSFTADIIVGFPGETNCDFDNTTKLVNEIEFTKVHIFPYSPRYGTVAQKMEGQISDKIKSERVKVLTNICNKIQSQILENQIGKVYNVLFEKFEDNTLTGYTENYLQITVYSDKDLSNSIKCVKINKIDNMSCIGKIID